MFLWSLCSFLGQTVSQLSICIFYWRLKNNQKWWQLGTSSSHLLERSHSWCWPRSSILNPEWEGNSRFSGTRPSAEKLSAKMFNSRLLSRLWDSFKWGADKVSGAWQLVPTTQCWKVMVPYFYVTVTRWSDNHSFLNQSVIRSVFDSTCSTSVVTRLPLTYSFVQWSHSFC